MKQFLVKLTIAVFSGIIVFILYGIWFFHYDPINYLGIKSHTVLTYDPVWKMKDFLDKPEANIILGNSQVAHIDVDTLEQYSSKRFSNIAFGGASLRESIDQFWWAANTTELKEVWIAISFYTLNKSYNMDRIEHLSELCTNFLAYMTDKYYISLAWNNFTGKEDHPANIPIAKEGKKYRPDLIKYAATIKYALDTPYKFNEQWLEELKELGNYCKTKGIKLRFIIPPMQESIFELAVKPLQLEWAVDKTSKTLSDISTTYDFEFDNSFTRNQDNFADGFHLKPSAQQKYIETLVEGKTCDIMITHEP